MTRRGAAALLYSQPATGRLQLPTSIALRHDRSADFFTTSAAHEFLLPPLQAWRKSSRRCHRETLLQLLLGSSHSAAFDDIFDFLERGGLQQTGRSKVQCHLYAASVSPEEAEHLHVTESEPPQDLKTNDSKHPAGAVWRRRGHPENSDRLSTSIFVDPPFLGFLVGKGGTTRQKIEKETGVTLLIPLSKEAKAGKHVVIKGESQQTLDKATQQVHEVIDQAIKSPMLPYSHFVSIPLAMQSKLLELVTDFQKSVLESGASASDDPGSKDKGIDKSIFVKPATFHLTLLMLKLWNKDRVQAAADCLQKVMPQVHEILEGSPLTIKLTGVDCMNGNPAVAHVLYADVEPDDQAGRLITASQVITEAFSEAGLVMDKDQTQSLKLHATLMNTSQRSKSGFGKRYHKRIPFDATEIMAKYGQFQWGQFHVAEAHLSERFRYDENGYYHCCTFIPFPPVSGDVPIPQ